MNYKIARRIFVFYLIVAVISIPGWIMNILDIIHVGFDPLTGLMAMRVVGVFVFPIGAILGLFW